MINHYKNDNQKPRKRLTRYLGQAICGTARAALPRDKRRRSRDKLPGSSHKKDVSLCAFVDPPPKLHTTTKHAKNIDSRKTEKQNSDQSTSE